MFRRLGRAYRLPSPEEPADVRGPAAFRAGFVASVANPKSGVFWTSVFGGALPPDAPLWFLAATTATIASIAAGWYVSVALLLGKAHVRSLFGRLRGPLDALLASLAAFATNLTVPTRRQVP
jgi:threonine/homoserine/homoserine lactone efflux protein